MPGFRISRQSQQLSPGQMLEMMRKYLLGPLAVGGVEVDRITATNPCVIL